VLGSSTRVGTAESMADDSFMKDVATATASVTSIAPVTESDEDDTMSYFAKLAMDD
jgi:hypothetical protein